MNAKSSSPTTLVDSIDDIIQNIFSLSFTSVLCETKPVVSGIKEENMALEDYKELIGSLATITTIIQFLAGIPVCQKYIANGSTGESSSAPFVSIFRFYIIEEILALNPP